jgi:hypothetical protein
VSENKFSNSKLLAHVYERNENMLAAPSHALAPLGAALLARQMEEADYSLARLCRKVIMFGPTSIVFSFMSVHGLAEVRSAYRYISEQSGKGDEDRPNETKRPY